MLKNIIFDFGGVICAYNPDDILSHFYDPADFALVKPVIYRNWAALDAGTADYAAYARETVSLLPERLAGATESFFESWFTTMPPMEDTWALIGRLKARGYRVFLLSNAPTKFAEHADGFSILKLMDGIVVSGPIRMSKPNADIFQHLLHNYGLKAEECMFIDDTPANAEGACRCGIHGYAFDGDADKLLREIERLS